MASRVCPFPLQNRWIFCLSVSMQQMYPKQFKECPVYRPPVSRPSCFHCRASPGAHMCNCTAHLKAQPFIWKILGVPCSQVCRSCVFMWRFGAESGGCICTPAKSISGCLSWAGWEAARERAQDRAPTSWECGEVQSLGHGAGQSLFKSQPFLVARHLASKYLQPTEPWFPKL